MSARLAFLVSMMVCAAASAADPPAVTVKAIPQNPRLDRPGAFAATLIVNSGSGRELYDLRLVLPPGSGFTVAENPKFPDSIPPYGSFLGSFSLQPGAGAGYGSHEIPIAVQYRWKLDNDEYTSSQAATMTVERRRLFEEEAKGLPGGTAALFWLLLPVFAAFFAYELVDRARRGEFVIPTFGSEYILPAFFVGSFVAAFASGSPYVLAGIAAAAGALLPALRWLWELWVWQRWAFREGDSEAVFLGKALLSPRAPRRFWRVTGTIDRQEWSGVRLAQPNGALVLGSELQLVVASEKDLDTVEKLVRTISADDWRAARRALVGLVEQKKVTVEKRQTVEPLKLLVTDDVAGFELSGTTQTELLMITGFAKENGARVQ